MNISWTLIIDQFYKSNKLFSICKLIRIYIVEDLMKHYFQNLEKILVKVKALNIPLKITLFDC